MRSKQKRQPCWQEVPRKRLPFDILCLIMYYPQEVGRNIDEILRALKALQVSDAKGVALFLKTGQTMS